MSTGLHKDLHYSEIHVVHHYEYADQAARLAATGFAATDIGRVARQLDNNSFWILVDDSPATWSPFSSTASSYEAETQTYTDTTNKIIGPLSSIPSDVLMVNLFVFEGPIQQYTQDYTVREVVGGSAPGFYVCISTSSTAPGGGSFSGGSNPGTGIDSILSASDKVRITYPTVY